jgi:hypothetical protein
MTVCALEALALRGCLAAGTQELARRFFQQAAKVVDTAWGIAAGSDMQLSEVKGKVSPSVRFVNWYLGKLLIAARRDPVVAQAFLRVANMLADPPSIMQPRIALRVLWGNLAWGERRQTGAAQAEVMSQLSRP